MAVRPDGYYVDATFGRGGHCKALLERLSPDARVLAIDRDPEAVAVARDLARTEPRLAVAHARFSQLVEFFPPDFTTVTAVLIDLGLSSPQLDAAERGFSFRYNAPLDMRMDPTSGISAAEWIAQAKETEISDVLWQLGDERRSRQIARRIVETRNDHPIRTTEDLARVVRACVRRSGRIDPATRSFQAIRIYINNEMGELEKALDRALERLEIGGRLLVIAFHSLEDRFVKHRFRELDKAGRIATDNRDQASTLQAELPRFRLLQRKAIMPERTEIIENPRARSARLRILERSA